VYYEKLLLAATKINVILVGEHRDSTILSFDDYSGRVRDSVVITTSTSYSVAIDAPDFVARNITFRNTSTAAQAVALRVNGDRQAYYDCNILGYQDTYYAWGGSATGRTYHKNCLVRGSVDFIFGRNIALFDSCTINVNRNTGTLTAASTELPARYGLVFRNSVITADSIGFDGVPITTFYLGRPWQASPRTVFLRCYEPSRLNAAGWQAWNVTPALYAEHRCTGPGAGTSGRVSWSSQLSDSAAALYTPQNIFAMNAYEPQFGFDWMPPPPPPISGVEEKGTAEAIPADFQLVQNFPNPFNPSTIIRYGLPRTSAVTVSIHNTLGQLVTTLVDGEREAGYHDVRFEAAGLASGVYFCRMKAGEVVRTRKLMLLR
jgi:pectinesterase